MEQLYRSQDSQAQDGRLRSVEAVARDLDALHHIKWGKNKVSESLGAWGVLRISGQQPRVNDEVIGKMVTVLLIYCCFNLC
jgi:hypothetical protein